MRRIIFILFLVFATIAVNAQQTEPTVVLSKSYYLEKGRAHNAMGWTLAAGGFVACAAGTVVSLRDAAESVTNTIGSIFGGAPVKEASNTGTLLFVSGGVALIISIPFFISATKNKNKALSLSLNNQAVPYLYNSSFTTHVVPSLSIKLSI